MNLCIFIAYIVTPVVTQNPLETRGCGCGCRNAPAGLPAGGFFPTPWVCLRACFRKIRTRGQSCGGACPPLPRRCGPPLPLRRWLVPPPSTSLAGHAPLAAARSGRLASGHYRATDPAGRRRAGLAELERAHWPPPSAPKVLASAGHRSTWPHLAALDDGCEARAGASAPDNEGARARRRSSPPAHSSSPSRRCCGPLLPPPARSPSPRASSAAAPGAHGEVHLGQRWIRRG